MAKSSIKNGRATPKRYSSVRPKLLCEHLNTVLPILFLAAYVSCCILLGNTILVRLELWDLDSI